MKRPGPRVAGLLLLAVIGLTSVPAATQDSTPVSPPSELLPNGTFEELDSAGAPINWRVEGLPVTGVSVRAVPSNSGRLGTRALRIVSQTVPAQIAAVNGPFDVRSVAGQTVEVSCFYRTKGSPKAHIDFDTYAVPFADQGWKTPHLTLEHHALTDTRDWGVVNWQVRVPPTAIEALVVIGLTGAGEVFIDDVSVRPATPPVRMEPLLLGDVTAWPSRREVRVAIINETSEQRSLKVSLTATPVRAAAKKVVATQMPARGRHEVVISYDAPVHESHRLCLALDDSTRAGVLDMLTLEVPALLTGRIVEPNFRGTLLSSIPGDEIIAEGHIAASESLCSEIVLEAELGGAGRVAREGKGITRPDGPRSWRLVIPRQGLLVGRYRLNIFALRDGKTVATLPLELTRAAQAEHEVGFDATGRLLVNGEPIFVNGLYNVAQPADLERAKAQGFNLVVTPTAAASQELIRTARGLGLMVILSSPVAPGPAGGTRPTFWHHIVAKFGGLPNVVGWHLLGAPDAALVLVDAFASQQAAMAQLDPYHPTVTRLCTPSLLPEYAPLCEIVAIESQPIPALPVDHIVGDLEAARHAARPGQPVWAVIQSVGRAWLVRGGGLETGVTGRPPTAAEHHAMTLLAVAHGAQGLLHHGFFFTSTRERPEYYMPRDASELWEGMKTTNALVSQVADAAAKGRYRGVTITGPVHVGAWELEGRLVVLAVNSQPSSVLTTFSVPEPAPHTLRRLEDGSEVPRTSKGQFADELPAYGGRVYFAPLTGS